MIAFEGEGPCSFFSLLYRKGEKRSFSLLLSLLFSLLFLGCYSAPAPFRFVIDFKIEFLLLYKEKKSKRGPAAEQSAQTKKNSPPSLAFDELKNHPKCPAALIAPALRWLRYADHKICTQLM